MKTTRATIAKVLAMLAFRCPGRDPLAEIVRTAGSDREAGELRESMILFWLDELSDLDEGVLLAATRDLCGAPGQWAPSVGDIRQRAVELSLGHLAPPSVGEAWGRVCEWARGEPIQLTDAEKAAAKRAGGTWELKHSENVTTTRAHFIRFYEEEVRKIVMTRRAHPETRELADHNRPALPPKPIRVSHPPIRAPASDPETIKRLLDQLPGYRSEYPDNEERYENDRSANRAAGAADPVAPEGARDPDRGASAPGADGAGRRAGGYRAPDPPGKVPHPAESGGAGADER